MQNQLLDIETVKGSVQSLGLNRTFPSLKKIEEIPMIVKRNTMTLYDFVAQYKQGRFEIEFSTSSYFKDKYIESTLLGLSNPEVIMYQQLSGNYKIVLGGQYLWTIINFMSNKKVLGKLQVLPQFDSLHFLDLPTEKQAYIQKFNLHYQTIETRVSSRLLKRFIVDKKADKKELDTHRLRLLIFDGRATRHLHELTISFYGETSVSNQIDMLRYLALSVYEKPNTLFDSQDTLFDAILYDMNQSWDESLFANIKSKLSNTFSKESSATLSELIQNVYARYDYRTRPYQF